MSMIPKTRLPMRIIALPLTTTVRSTKHTSDAPSPLVYYHFQTPPPPEGQQQSWAKWAQTKASDIWVGFGKAPQTNWKYKVFKYGERIMDRVEFEELALNGLDPSLGPSVSMLQGASEKKRKMVIPLVHPKSMGIPTIKGLETLLSKRAPRHLRGAWTWALISPLTAPFMIIQVCTLDIRHSQADRAHDRLTMTLAYRASEYLQSLMKEGHIVSQPSRELDEIYVAHAPSLPPAATRTEALNKATRPEASEAGELPREPQVILTRAAVPPVLSLFGLPLSSARDVYRAIEQARLRIEQGVYK